MSLFLNTSDTVYLCVILRVQYIQTDYRAAAATNVRLYTLDSSKA
jgi:hypothetical protein